MNELKNVEDFAGYIMERLKGIYGEQRRVELKSIPKNNGVSLLAFTIGTNKNNLGPAIYVNPYHTQYLLGNMSLDEIIEDIVVMEKITQVPAVGGVDGIGDFESVKNKIVFRLINAEWNKEMLENVPHIQYLDLAIIFCLALGCNKLGTLSAVIYKEHMEYWNSNVKELWKLAADNTPKEYPLEVRSMNDIICDMLKDKLGDEFDETLVTALLCDEDECQPMYVVSNASGIYGAGSILYKDALKNIAEKLDGDVIVIPSSLHEMLVTKYTAESNFEDLSNMVRMINQRDVAEEERLSDGVYLYRRDTERIKCMK